MATMTLLTLVPGGSDAPRPFVLVDSGSEAEALWRSRGYLAEAELAEAGASDAVADSAFEPKRRGRKPKEASA
jgi:hypothetical protein